MAIQGGPVHMHAQTWIKWAGPLPCCFLLFLLLLVLISKANQQAEEWIEKGYDQAYVVSYGNEETGNVWYRVRIGQFNTREMAERLQEKLREDHDAVSWVSRTGQPVEEEAMQGN